MNDRRSTCCRDCEKRHEGCHSDCPDYAALKVENEKASANRRKAYAVEVVLHDGYVRRRRKYEKKVGRKI